MRIDRLFCYLRFVRTRSQAQHLIEQGHVRCNRVHVDRASHDVVVGDVLTFPLGNTVRIARILALPQRRGPAAEAQACYQLLDP